MACHLNGGGCCILISNSLKCNRLDFVAVNEHLLVQSGCEVICLDVNFGCDKFRLILIYRPPSSSYDCTNSSLSSSIALSSLLENICDVQHSCVVLGDLNLPNVNWSDYSNVADHSTNCLLDFFSNYGFVQFVNQPTRISHFGRGNILDVVLSTDQFAIRVNEVGIPFSTSDHCTVDFCIVGTSVRTHLVDSSLDGIGSED